MVTETILGQHELVWLNNKAEFYNHVLAVQFLTQSKYSIATNVLTGAKTCMSQ